MADKYDNLRLFRRFAEVRDELENLVNAFLAPLQVQSGKNIHFPMDIYVENGSLIIEIEMPGVERESFTLEAASSFLQISGRKDTLKRKYQTCLSLERESGAFHKIVYLEKSVNFAKAQTVLDNGILTITIPLIEERRKRKTIDIV